MNEKEWQAVDDYFVGTLVRQPGRRARLPA